MEVHVEVFVTGDGASSSSSKTRKAAKDRAVAERTEPSDPLRAVMQSLRIPIGTDVDATNVAEARTQLEDRRQQMLDLSETLAATRRRLEATQMEHDAAHGLTPAAALASADFLAALDEEEVSMSVTKTSTQRSIALAGASSLMESGESENLSASWGYSSSVGASEMRSVVKEAASASMTSSSSVTVSLESEKIPV